MISLLRSSIVRRVLLIAAPLAVCLVLLFPAVASAHAILLRSDPAKDAVLTIAPRQVRMWFTEDLNSTFTTASVVSASNTDASNVNAPGHRVDNGDAHVSLSDPKEMDITLPANLPPAAYIVLYRTDSAQDGHILRGSFLFFIARPDGSVPTANGNAIAGNNTLDNGSTTGRIDGPALFNLVMITLVELGAVFWVGAQLWLVFVLQPVTEDHKEQRAINRQVQQRFERRFSVPTLLVLLLANIGVVVGQALNITGGQLVPALSPTLLAMLATSGQFGTYWTMRQIVIVLALILALYILLAKQRQPFINKILSWTNLVLGLALFIAMVMSGHAAAVNKSIVSYAVPIDWLHLLAAALWIGGMMYIATTYLPIIGKRPIAEQAQSLITVLPYYSTWALAGVVIMSITGPFNATFHLTSWAQLITTAYGLTLTVKVLLIGALLITSAIHVGLLRPRLKREYKKYTYAVGRLASDQATTEQVLVKTESQSRQNVQRGSEAAYKGESDVDVEEGISSRSSIDKDSGMERGKGTTGSAAQQVRLREGRLSKKTQLLTKILRWEPLLGVAVLICVGLMNVFAGTISPVVAAQQQQQTTTNAKPFNTMLKTADNKFTVMFNVNPDRFGTNVFTVSVVDNSTGKPATNIGVALYTTMLDMDMGTDNVNLLPDGKGHFSASGDLSMGGHWQMRIQIRTPDATLHEARVQFVVSF